MSLTAGKIARVLREEGVLGLWRRAVRRVWRRRVMILFARDLSLPDVVPLMPRQPTVIRFVGEQELPLVAPLVSAEKLALFRRRLAQGMSLGLVLSGDEKTALGWFWNTGRSYYEEYDSATYRAWDGEMYHFDGEVVKDHRGRAVAFTAFPLIWSHWRARGYRRSLCTVEDDNRASLKLHRRLHYEPIGRLTIHTLFGFQWSTSDEPHMAPGDWGARA